MWPGVASWVVWGAVSQRRAGGAEKACGSGGCARALSHAAGAPRRATEAQFWRRTTQAPQDAGCAGPADAVLTDRFAVSMTADVDAQRVAVAQKLATAPPQNVIDDYPAGIGGAEGRVSGAVFMDNECYPSRGNCRVPFALNLMYVHKRRGKSDSVLLRPMRFVWRAVGCGMQRRQRRSGVATKPVHGASKV